MNTSPRRDGAKIYQFPSRSRHLSTDAQRIEPRGPVQARAVCDTGAWYHEAAIQEEVRGRRS
jgi:hypothetical protein